MEHTAKIFPTFFDSSNICENNSKLLAESLSIEKWLVWEFQWVDFPNLYWHLLVDRVITFMLLLLAIYQSIWSNILLTWASLNIQLAWFKFDLEKTYTYVQLIRCAELNLLVCSTHSICWIKLISLFNLFDRLNWTYQFV